MLTKDSLKRFDIDLNDKNFVLYKAAFTHNSYANENNLDYSYQRLEFLGDSILSKEISLYLFSTYPNKDEGEITHLRSIMVRKDTLADIAKFLKLNSLIFLGKGEIKTKGYNKDSLLADILESFIAAIYLDKGAIFLSNFIEKYLIKYIIDCNYFHKVIDYKTQLQEQLQINSRIKIQYNVVKEERETKKEKFNNKILYNVIVVVDKIPYGKGYGYSIKEAEQYAAQSALRKLASK